MIQEKILGTRVTTVLEQDHALKENRGETHLEIDIEMNIETHQETEIEIEDTQIEATAGREEETMELKGLECLAMAIQGDPEGITRSP